MAVLNRSTQSSIYLSFLMFFLRDSVLSVVSIHWLRNSRKDSGKFYSESSIDNHFEIFEGTSFALSSFLIIIATIVGAVTPIVVVGTFNFVFLNVAVPVSPVENAECQNNYDTNTHRASQYIGQRDGNDEKRKARPSPYIVPVHTLSPLASDHKLYLRRCD